MDQSYCILTYLLFIIMPFQLTALAITANCEDNNLTLIDTDKWQIIKTLPVGKNPRELVWDDAQQKLYVSNSGDNSISIVDLYNFSIRHLVLLSEPRGIAVDENNHIYVVLKNDDCVSVIDAQELVQLNTQFVGLGPRNILLHENCFFVSNNQSHTVSYGSEQLSTAPYPYGLCLHNHLLYVTSIGLDCICVFDLTTKSELYRIKVARHPTAMAVNTQKQLMYCTALDDHQVCVIDITKKSVIKTIDVGCNPFALALSPNGKYLLVTNNGDHTISVIDTETHAVIECLPVGKDPHGIIWLPELHF